MLVEDVLRTVAFYRDVLGFDVVLIGPSAGRGQGVAWALLRCGPAEVFVQSRAVLEGTLPLPALARPGAVTLYLATPDVAALYARVRSHACLIRPPHRLGPGTRALAVLDPDGVLLVFSESAERTARAA